MITFSTSSILASNGSDFNPYTLLPIAIISLIQIIMSFIVLKSNKLRKIIEESKMDIKEALNLQKKMIYIAKIIVVVNLQNKYIQTTWFMLSLFSRFGVFDELQNFI